VRQAETEGEFETLLKMARMVMAFVEAGFFGEKTIACLERIRKEKPRLRVVLFSVSARTGDETRRYLWQGADNFISLREKPELVREQMKTVFNDYDRMSKRTLSKTREHNRLSGIPPHLTVQEVAVCRYAAREKERKEIAVCLGVSVKTVDNHLHSIRRKFRKRNMVGILKVAVSAGILSPEELMCRDFDYPALPLTDRTC
jgi:DNA-binding NarL/FixJ family response regulator